MKPLVQEDPLRKREEFAVSLRKAKTRQIIKAKRTKLLQIRQESLNAETEIQTSSRQTCLDKANPEYFGYYLLGEVPGLFK